MKPSRVVDSFLIQRKTSLEGILSRFAVEICPKLGRIVIFEKIR
jgi:hypothetical protein